MDALINIHFGHLYQIHGWYQSAVLVLDNSMLQILHDTPAGDKQLLVLVGPSRKFHPICCHCYDPLLFEIK